MARRKQKNLVEPATLVRLLLTVGAIWVITQLLRNFPSGTGGAFGWLILATAATAMAYPLVRLSRRARARRALLRKTTDLCDAQSASLIRRRAQLVQPDAYGKPQIDKWAKEIDYFISRHIRPLLTPSEQMALEQHYSAVAEILGVRVEAAMCRQPASEPFSDNMTPAEFEASCAEALRRVGWDARVTMHSRDQGVDVIAEKNGRRIVLQCKLYACRPVGNKSVQEVTAARGHEQANFGIVVSNNRYTAAAEQLAATNDVLLLHYRDLKDLDNILDTHLIKY